MSFPQKVYQYRKFSERTIEALCWDKLYFANPNSFNDPMDCKPDIRVDSKNDELKAIFKRLVIDRVEQEILSSLKSAKIKNNSSQDYAARLANKSAFDAISSVEYYATNPEYEEQDISEERAQSLHLQYEIRKELLDKYHQGVCCFSSTYDNSLLWSHYGDEHRGFCIGYSLKRDPIPQLHKVIYGDNRSLNTSVIARAILHNDTAARKSMRDSMLLKKGSHWKYEEEWRIFNKVGLNDSPLAMTDVTFGLRCPDAIVHTVSRALEGRGDIQFYQIHQKHNSHRLLRKPVDGEVAVRFPLITMSGKEAFG